MRTSLLAGHALIDEGWPYLGTEIRKDCRQGYGMAKCRCGAMSGILPSAGARKQWHREHKEAVRAAQP